MFLDELPRDLILTIFGGGLLEVPDIVSLDTALCSAQLRTWIHQVYDGLRSCSFDDWEYNSITALRWAMDRKIDLQNFKLRLCVRESTTWKCFSHMESFHMVIFMGLVDVARLLVTKTPVAVNSSTMIGVQSIKKCCDLLISQTGQIRNSLPETIQSPNTAKTTDMVDFDNDDESWSWYYERSNESYDFVDSVGSWSHLTGREIRCNALKLACLRGDESMVRMLLTDGAADPNHGTEETNFELRPLLYASVSGGNPANVMRILLDAGACSSTIELTMAVKHCEFLCCVESSINSKRTINFDSSSIPSVPDDFSENTRAIHHTFAHDFLRCDLSEAWRNQLDAVRFLSSHVRVDEGGSGTEFHPWDPPLQCAAEMGLHEVVSTLLEHCGADPNNCRSEDSEYSEGLDYLRPEIYPPLEIAMTCPRFETFSHRVDWYRTIKELIGRGAKVNKLDTHGCLYVHHLCSKCHSWTWDDKSLDILRLFYDYGGADINLVDASGATLLYLFCFWMAESPNSDSIDVINMLLDFSADANLAHPKRGNQTALHAVLVRTKGLEFDFAISREVIGALLTKGGADPNRVDEDGNTPLHYIAQHCAQGAHNEHELYAESKELIYQIIALLISHGAQTGKENKAGLTPAALYKRLYSSLNGIKSGSISYSLLSKGILSALKGRVGYSS